MSWMIGDWTTWEGLAGENSYEPEPRWGATAQPLKPAADGWNAARSVGGRKPTPTKKHAGVANRGIEKKKKRGPRGGGLMKWNESTEENDENVAPPTPYIVSSKNPYAALGEAMDAEEAAEAEAARVAAEERQAADEELAKKVAAKEKAKEDEVAARAAKPQIDAILADRDTSKQQKILAINRLKDLPATVKQKAMQAAQTGKDFTI